MKKMNSALAMIAAMTVMFLAPSARAEQLPSVLSSAELLQLLAPENLVNWKVGDSANYNVSAQSFNLGTMVKEVSKEEGAAVWVHQAINAMGQNQTVDALINRADAKILKYVVNGQEQSVPDDKIEIISQDYVDVTVPAGTFKAVHVVAKTQQISKLEIWANPRDTVMDGAIKQYVEGGMLPMTIELTSFKRMP